MAPTLAYWDIRGLAQPIRLLLHYTGTEFEDKLYVCGDAPEYNRDCWLKEKFTLGLHFPNLPYYIDGDIKISQSNAIMRHIARKHDLCGSSEEEKVRVDLIENQMQDFRKQFTILCYGPKFEEKKPAYIENAKKGIQAISDFLGDHQFFAGDKITFVDFIVYEALDHHRLFEPSLVEADNLKAFLARIEALPAIAEYMKSDKFISRPINNKMANFK